MMAARTDCNRGPPEPKVAGSSPAGRTSVPRLFPQQRRHCASQSVSDCLGSEARKLPRKLPVSRIAKVSARAAGLVRARALALSVAHRMIEMGVVTVGAQRETMRRDRRGACGDGPAQEVRDEEVGEERDPHTVQSVDCLTGRPRAQPQPSHDSGESSRPQRAGLDRWRPTRQIR